MKELKWASLLFPLLVAGGVPAASVGCTSPTESACVKELGACGFLVGTCCSGLTCAETERGQVCSR
jgi:hypothetical protein